MEWELIGENHFNKGRSLFLKENNERLRFLSEEEIAKLIDASSPHLRDIVICALNTGMRRGEIFSLKWDQIRNGFIYLEKTKTNESRQIPVNETLEELFKNIRKKNQFKSEYVFTYAKNEHRMINSEERRHKFDVLPISESKHSFGTALKKAGIENFRFHDLRHTFASQMILRGASLKVVQEILGHKNISMTMRYAHLSQEHKREAVNLLNDLPWSQMVTKCHFGTKKEQANVS